MVFDRDNFNNRTSFGLGRRTSSSNPRSLADRWFQDNLRVHSSITSQSRVDSISSSAGNARRVFSRPIRTSSGTIQANSGPRVTPTGPSFSGSSGATVVPRNAVSDTILYNHFKAPNSVSPVPSPTDLMANPNYRMVRNIFNDYNFTTVTDQDRFDILLQVKSEDLRNLFSADLNANNVLDLVNAFDKDSNGFIVRTEFVEGYLAHKNGTHSVDPVLLESLVIEDQFEDVRSYVDLVTDSSGVFLQNRFAAAIIGFKNNTVRYQNDRLFLNTIRDSTDNGEIKKLIDLISAKQETDLREYINIAFAAKDSRLFSSINADTFTTILNSIEIKNIDLATKTEYQSVINHFNLSYNATDLTAKGFISNEDIVTTLLGQKTATLNFNEDILRTVALSANKDFDDLKRIVDIFDTNSSGDYSSAEVLKGLLALNKLKLTLADGLLNASLGTSAALKDQLWPLVQEFDKDKDGVISEADYAAVMLKIISGERAAIDSTLLSLIQEELESNHIFIDEAVQAFSEFYGHDDISVQELSNKFREVISNGSGVIDFARSLAVTKALPALYPNADQIINLYTNFDSSKDGTISDNELIKGMLAYQRGDFIKASSPVIQSIVELNEHADEIRFALGEIDSNQNGEISDKELIDSLISLQQGEYDSDTLNFNEAIFRQVLAEHPNYSAASSVLASFDLGITKPSSLVLAAHLKVKVASGHAYETNVRDKFLELIGMSGLSKAAELANLDAVIAGITAQDGFLTTGTERGIKQDLLYDKILLINKGSLRSSQALLAVLKTNPGYDRADQQIKKYFNKGLFTEDSLIALVVDSMIDTDAIIEEYQRTRELNDEQIAKIEEAKTNQNELNYFLNLFEGNVSPVMIEDYRSGLDLQAGDPVPTDLEITQRIRDSILADNLTGLNITVLKDHYAAAFAVLDPDANGTISQSDYYAHDYYFSEQYASTAPVQYDFNGDDDVDSADRDIFTKLGRYLRSNRIRLS